MTTRLFSWLAGVAITIVWAVGYFFGFSLVGILSLGLIVPAPFNEIADPRPPWSRGILFRRHGRSYLSADVVALVGWLFLGIGGWWLFSLFSPYA